MLVPLEVLVAEAAEPASVVSLDELILAQAGENAYRRLFPIDVGKRGRTKKASESSMRCQGTKKKPPTDCSKLRRWQGRSAASCILDFALQTSLPNGKRIYLPSTSFSGQKIEKNVPMKVSVGGSKVSGLQRQGRTFAWAERVLQPPLSFWRSRFFPRRSGHFGQKLHLQSGANAVGNLLVGIVAASGLGLQPHGNDVFVRELLDVISDDVQK
jgi:hypothetical protein